MDLVDMEWNRERSRESRRELKEAGEITTAQTESSEDERSIRSLV